MQPHVLIAGGGIGGLTAALALLRSGCDVDVYEQAAELTEVGAGLQLAANGTRVLHELGIGEQLKQRRDLEAVRSRDRKSTRLNSSHGYISYAVFCLKKKKNNTKY